MPTVQSGATYRQTSDSPAAGESGRHAHGAAAAESPVTNANVELTDYQSVRAEIERLGEIVSAVVEARAHAAADVVANGARASRRIIRRNPWGSLVGAGAAGALLALAVAPRSGAPSHARTHAMRRAMRRGWANVPMAPNAFLAEIGPYLSSVRMPSAPSMQSISLGDRVERLGEAIAGLDAKSAAEPLLNTVRQIAKAVSDLRKLPV